MIKPRTLLGTVAAALLSSAPQVRADVAPHQDRIGDLSLGLKPSGAVSRIVADKLQTTEVLVQTAANSSARKRASSGARSPATAGKRPRLKGKSADSWWRPSPDRKQRLQQRRSLQNGRLEVANVKAVYELLKLS